MQLEHLLLKSRDEFFFKVPHPNFIDLNNYLKEVEEDEKNFIKKIVKLNLISSNELLLFRNSKKKIGVIGKAFTGWAPDNTPPLSIKIFHAENVQEIYLLNMCPAAGPGYGSVTFSCKEQTKEMILFFLNANRNDWDEKFKKTKAFLEEIKQYTRATKIYKSKNSNS